MAKYFITEEVIRVLEMRMASDERRRLTKFITIISIAVFIEGLVTVVRVSKQDVEKMFYPTLLLLTAILIVIGLGLYQRLSVPVEQQDDDNSNKAKAKSKEQQPHQGVMLVLVSALGQLLTSSRLSSWVGQKAPADAPRYRGAYRSQ